MEYTIFLFLKCGKYEVIVIIIIIKVSVLKVASRSLRYCTFTGFLFIFFSSFYICVYIYWYSFNYFVPFDCRHI